MPLPEGEEEIGQRARGPSATTSVSCSAASPSAAAAAARNFICLTAALETSFYKYLAAAAVEMRLPADCACARDLGASGEASWGKIATDITS
jgi:hypothetical protein